MEGSGPEKTRERSGTNIAQYHVLERLGGGGMGVVYKAEDTRLKRLVALKFMTSGVFATEEHRARFLREARAAAALDHPNICTIYEIVEDEGETCLAMSYVDGPSLQALIKTGPMKTERALEIATQAAQGLEEAHRKGIVHRDIKSGNIMLTAAGLVKIVDFGLAHLGEETRITREGTTLGTPAYMAPEQWTGATVDHRVDLWSLGVVVYEMVSGQLPFRGQHHRTLGYQIVNDPPPPLVRIQQGTPEGLQQVLEKALAKRPQDRYRDAAQMLDDLRALREGRQPPAASRPTQDQDDIATQSLVHLELLDTRQGLRPQRRSWIRNWILIALVAVAAAVGAWLAPTLLRRTPPPAPTAAPPSIAVLPFADDSPGKGDEFFGDGLAEELINTLTKVETLRVVARTSAFQFKGKDQDVGGIGQQLRVGAVLTGTVRKTQGRLRVTAQLINVADGFQIWSEIYNRSERDVFLIQQAITEAIIQKLNVRLTSTLAVRPSTQNPQAYDLYLQGRFHWNRRSEEGLRKSVEYFEKAVAFDVRYAPAYSGLADAYALIGLYGWSAPSEVMPKARRAALQALAIDASLAEAHNSMGLIELVQEWNWQESEKAFRRALELNPGYSSGHHWYAHHLAWSGRFAEAMEEIRRAQDLDPLALSIKANIGWFQVLQRNYAEAERQLRAILDLDPNYVRAHYYLSIAYERSARFDQAIASALKGRELTGGGAAELAQLGRTNARRGRLEEARRQLGELTALASRRYVPPVEFAALHLGLGENEEALRWLLRAAEERSAMLIFVKVDPRWDRLRGDARFTALVRKISGG